MKKKGVINIFIIIFSLSLFLSILVLAHPTFVAQAEEEKIEISVYATSIDYILTEGYRAIDYVKLSDGELKSGHKIYDARFVIGEDCRIVFKKNMSGGYLVIKDKDGNDVSSQYEVTIDEKHNGYIHKFKARCNGQCINCDYKKNFNVPHDFENHTAIDNLRCEATCADCGYHGEWMHSVGYLADENGTIAYCSRCKTREMLPLCVKAHFVAFEREAHLYPQSREIAYYDEDGVLNKYILEPGTISIEYRTLDINEDGRKLRLEDLSYNENVVQEIIGFKETETPDVYNFTIIGKNGEEEEVTLYFKCYYQKAMNCIRPSLDRIIIDKLAQVGISFEQAVLIIFAILIVVTIVVIVVVKCKNKNKKSAKLKSKKR